MQKAVRTEPEPIPRPALALGLLGLIPFVVLPVAALSGVADILPAAIGAHATVPALLLYAAVILSFMGGAQWGLAMTLAPAGERWRAFGVSVLPALLAWAATLMPIRTGLAMAAAGFVLLLIYDLWTVKQAQAPQWYERLRVMLTSVVVTSLTLTLVFVV